MIIAPFVKEKFGWTNSDTCWWCGSTRQTREHLFKECITWRVEIRELRKEVGEISGHAEAWGNVASGMYKGRKGGFHLGEMQEKKRTGGQKDLEVHR